MNSLKFNDVCNSKIQLNHALPSVVNLKVIRETVNSDYIYVTKTYPRVNSSWVPTYGVAAEMVIVELTVGADVPCILRLLPTRTELSCLTSLYSFWSFHLYIIMILLLVLQINACLWCLIPKGENLEDQKQALIYRTKS